MESIVGRIKFPKSMETVALYIQGDGTSLSNLPRGNQGIVLQQGKQISSSSYFNSFYEGYYTQYTKLTSIGYRLKLEGSFKVCVYREKAGDREKVSEASFENCQASDPVQLTSITLLQGDDAGRLYVELHCLSDRGIFHEGWIITDEEKAREVSVGIVICTFKKEEYVKNTLAIILQDEQLQEKDFKVFVVDNGQTLDRADFNDPRVQLIPNKNAGGSGGFTRGLMEALADQSRSHFLVMDDDIEFESESLFRLFSIHEYAKTSFVVVGGLISLNQRHILHEAGATYNGSPIVRGRPGTLTALNHRMDLRTAQSLNQLVIEGDADYGGFWFCSFSRAIIESIKLPLPLFIKLDDVEFCMRAKRSLNIPIVPFPSLAVWHIPASDKDLNWETYYYFRNDFITYAIHFSPEFDPTVSNLTQQITLALSKGNYDRAHMIMTAFEDYLKGSSFITDSEPDTLHPYILKLSRTYENQEQIDADAVSNELLARWSDVIAQGRGQWSAVSQDWKQAAPEMTSTSFWQRYLGINQTTQTANMTERNLVQR
jgi:galactofuranosylgalactofuranosylrhamnosyl-N-acetylglucosaminyl-diphospho-decaprenol beta-1,5/1,6-galactofuranosyltransferase